MISGEKWFLVKPINIVSINGKIVQTHDYPNKYKSTACYRGYSTCLEIIAGKLYISKIEGKFRLTKDNKLCAEWLDQNIYIRGMDSIQNIQYPDLY